MNLNHYKAQKVYTTKCNLRKNLSEDDFDLWQAVLTAGVTKTTSRSVGNFGFLVGAPNGSSVDSP